MWLDYSLSYSNNLAINSNTFRYKCDGDLPFVKEEKEDRMKLRTIEMPKVDLNRQLEDMNEQEKMIYYFLNCHKGMEDSKIKMMIESDEIIWSDLLLSIRGLRLIIELIKNTYGVDAITQ